MAPEDTLWTRDPHTEGKHLVLRAYLDAWLPIMGRWNGRILFIDGFAGPGQYVGGEDGSPLIALRSLIEHNAKKTIKAQVVFFFIEERADRADHLEGLVNEVIPDLPKTATATVVKGTFDQALEEVLDALEEQKKRLAPALVMIDPFGVSGIPMSVIARILENPRCEVYVSFMYESMNRFLNTAEFEGHLDELFGTDQWREALELNGEDRRRFLYGLYEDQLRENGAKHVLHFNLYEGNRLVYAIFFGTQHEVGCDRMKQAIWKAAPAGDYEFRGSRSGQLFLGVDEPDYSILRAQLTDRFQGEEWIGIEEVKRFVASDKTEFHSSHLKRPVLKPMEEEGLIEVDESTRKNKGTFPDGTKLKFVG
jgi:three-Cys-motif partner protein